MAASPGIPRGNRKTSRYIARVPTALHAESLSHNKSRWTASALLCMRSQGEVSKGIAAAFLAGSLEEGVEERIAKVINASPKQIRGLVTRLITHFGTKRRPRAFRVERFIREDRGFLRLGRRKDSFFKRGFNGRGKCRLHPGHLRDGRCCRLKRLVRWLKSLT